MKGGMGAGAGLPPMGGRGMGLPPGLSGLGMGKKK